jgi:hypothetical protein
MLWKYSILLDMYDALTLGTLGNLTAEAKLEARIAKTRACIRQRRVVPASFLAGFTITCRRFPYHQSIALSNAQIRESEYYLWGLADTSSRHSF